MLSFHKVKSEQKGPYSSRHNWTKKSLNKDKSSDFFFHCKCSISSPFSFSATITRQYSCSKVIQCCSALVGSSGRYSLGANWKREKQYFRQCPFCAPATLSPWLHKEKSSEHSLCCLFSKLPMHFFVIVAGKCVRIKMSETGLNKKNYESQNLI